MIDQMLKSVNDAVRPMRTMCDDAVQLEAVRALSMIAAADGDVVVLPNDDLKDSRPTLVVPVDVYERLQVLAKVHGTSQRPDVEERPGPVSREPQPTGQMTCWKCQNAVIRTGTCFTCQSCGETTGCA